GPVLSYIIRRLFLILPTLFGVTVVSFCIMQLAPGDPLLMQLGATGLAGQGTQTREAYLIQKRDLKLDRPLILNFRYFRDYSEAVRQAAHFLIADQAEIVEELNSLAADPNAPDRRAAMRFLRSLGIPRFRQRLADPAEHPRLAKAITAYARVFCEDLGIHGVPPLIELLRRPDIAPSEKIGIIHALNAMVVQPFTYTYSHVPKESETPYVVGAWRQWWRRAEPLTRPLPDERRAELDARFRQMLSLSRRELFEELDYLDPADTRFYIEKLLSDCSLRERFLAALALRRLVRDPLRLDVPDRAPDEWIQEAADNWLVHYELNRQKYEPPVWKRCVYLFADTQYAHMLWRLATFQFGRSATKTREPVAAKIWNAVLVSAPLMLMAELVIYLLAIPAGIAAAVYRNTWIDRAITVKLFLLYSIPPFVAGMLLLLFFCYGDYLKWFPMMGLHSPEADRFGWGLYLLDYLWHAFLPVVCLSLFSLAGLAMYSRTAMLDVISQDYIRTARAKGLPESKVIFKHAMRNALIPILTLFSSFLPALLGGSVLVEYIFGIHGMGRLSWESIEQKDYPTLMALIYIDAIVVLVSILLTDILYTVVDPRISFASQDRQR
ncbi:MAG: ABC transporter permease subunit, partial [Thermogutta sp.]|nr:ABC transporter permease subunit [Thermogutta sp.]